MDVNEAQPVLATMRLNPYLFIDVTESMSDVTDEQKQAMENVHGFNTWMPFFRPKPVPGKTVPTGIMVKALSAFGRRFSTLKRTPIIAIGDASMNDGIDRIIGNTVEQTIMDLYKEGCAPYVEGGELWGTEPMQYDVFSDSTNFEARTFTVLHEQQDDDAGAMETAHIIVMFRTRYYGMQESNKIEMTLTNMMSVSNRNSTEKTSFVFGIFMSTANLDRQKVYEIFDFGMNNMEYLPKSKLIKLAMAENGTALYNEYMELQLQYPVLTIGEDDVLSQIDNLYGLNDILFLHKPVKEAVVEQA